MVLMLPGSRTVCTPTRGQISPDISPPQFSTVRTRHLSLHTHIYMPIPSALGFLIALFFKCMDALLNPFYRRGDRIRWGLVSYTVIVFLFATVQTAVGLRSQSICYIDNRKFPGVEGTTLPGPMGYLAYIYHEALGVIPNVMFFLSGWLADGLLVSSPLDPAFTDLGV